MKNLLIFFLVSFWSQPALSYNGRLLDFEADGFITAMDLDRKIEPHEIIRDLSFVGLDETELFDEYRAKPTFAPEKEPIEPDLKHFFKLCKESYDGHKEIKEEAKVDFFEPTMVAVQMLYEQVEKFYRKRQEERRYYQQILEEWRQEKAAKKKK